MSDSVEQIDQRSGRKAVPCVLLVVPALGEGGAERGTLDLARFMAEHGWTPLVASSGGRGESELRRLGITTFRMPLHRKNPLEMRANVGRLQRLAQAHGVQLIHAHSRAGAWSACYAARWCKLPFVTTLHGVHRAGGFLKHRYNAIMTKGDRVIAVSEHVAQHARERYGVAADRLRVIYPGIDIDAFAIGSIERSRLDRLARQWQVPERMKIVMLPGRITQIKGHLLLLEAIAQMVRRNVTCLLVGNGDRRSAYRREIERQIGARDLANVVRLVGGCSDMPAALALADVVVVPSSGPEAFGRVSVEAQALGRPVVATDVGGLGETLMPASTGWLVPPDDPVALARALELALDMPDDARARLALRARRWVERRFTVERMAESTMALYHELLGADAPAAAPCVRVPPASSDD
jgi:glycosyltransferase involved in cell wall biosynthesis